MSKTIDSRDLATRLEELAEKLDAHKEALTRLEEAKQALSDYKLKNPNRQTEELDELQDVVDDADMDSDDNELSRSEEQELDELRILSNSITDFEDGATLIREDYFVEYCEELVKDIGDLPSNLPSYIVIDWEQTADNLRQDYIEVEYQGNTFLVRA